MKTLIELFDERAIENVLATEVFRPERTVFLCPADVAKDRILQQKLRDYFVHRGLTVETVFLESSLYSSDKVLAQLRRIFAEYEDCALDITGGTDAALFACGLFCAETPIPTFTYARRSNRFYDIHNAAFADRLSCTVIHQVEDCIRMAGGSVHQGRVDNTVLPSYAAYFDPFFRLFLRYRSGWTRIIRYFQLVSQTEKGQPIPLNIDAPAKVPDEKGSQVNISFDCLRDLEKLGFLQELKLKKGSVSFRFRDEQVRTWLRDIGSVLELYVYQACVDTGLFHDVRNSVVVDWAGCSSHGNVVNEIDVMATHGILPVFISCKTCEISTEALNELDILRERFGGKGSRAAIVTAKNCNSATRHRAAELGIDVIDLCDLKKGQIKTHLTALTRTN